MLSKIDNKNLISRCPIFEGMPELFMAHLEEKVEYTSLPKYSVLYHCDDPANKVYFLLDGLVKISNYCEHDPTREIIKSLQHPYNMFGTEGLLGSAKRGDCAQSMNFDIKFAQISTADFQGLLRTYPAFRMRFLELIGSRLRKAERRLESLVFKDARARLVDFLKECANANGWKVGYEMLVKHSLTQQDIANIIGASRQTVTMVMNDMKKGNQIHFDRRRILIRDMENLA